MVDMHMIQGTIASLKFAGDVAKSLLELKTLGDVQGKVIELQSAILSAQGSALSANAEQSAMVEEIRKLKEEIASVKAWQSEKQRYKLTNQWDGGGVAYALKETMANGEPPHVICTKCYEDGRKSILNPSRNVRGFLDYVCPICSSQIPTGYRGGATPEYAAE